MKFFDMKNSGFSAIHPRCILRLVPIWWPDGMTMGDMADCD
ncbi:hypothetical protein [Pararcticibacter amylolyticus]|nr:hypothetical protein [Pararcticibacter amylolyticus]